MYTDQKDHDACVRRAFFPFHFFRFDIASQNWICSGVGCFEHAGVKTWSPLHYRHSQSPFPIGNTMRINPVFENDDGVLTHVSSILCPMSSDSGSLQHSGQGTFRSLESIQLSIEVKCTAEIVFLIILII